MEDENVGKYSIGCYRSEEFPPMGLDLWAAPGTKINISGNDTYIYTWKVKSPIEQQKARSTFVNNSKELWNEYQRFGIERSKLRRAMYAGNLTEKQEYPLLYIYFARR